MDACPRRSSFPQRAGSRPLLVAAFTVLLFAPVGIAGPIHAQETAPKSDKPSSKPPNAEAPKPEGTMTLKRLDEIIRRLDEKAQSPRPGFWQFEVEKRTVMIVTDVRNNRMRIMVPIGPAANVTDAVMKRLMQANFDTALDSRYAVAREILWATFIHPLKALHDRQFVEAIGQTVNLAVTFGTTYSSGLLSFGGGDSRGIIQRKLIDGLLQKGLPI